MPGLTSRHPDATLSVIKKSGDGVADSQSPERSSRPPPYPFQTTTTAYGLNEPQWSFGPPPILLRESPYARVPLPRLGRVGIHEILKLPDDRRDAKSPFEWRVTQPPSCAKIALYGNHYHWKAMPAIEARSAYQSTLTVRVPSFSRPIVIFPSKPNSRGGGGGGGVITIGDVLNAIYKGLRQCANDVLCESLQIVPSHLSDQLRTFHEATLTSLPAKAAIDAMNGGGGEDAVSTLLAAQLGFDTEWAGLAPSDVDWDVWILHTKRHTSVFYFILGIAEGNDERASGAGKIAFSKNRGLALRLSTDAAYIRVLYPKHLDFQEIEFS